MTKRPDRSEKLKLRKLNDETVVKCSIYGLVLQNKELVDEAIRKRVEGCSRRIHNASLALNYMIREWFHNQEDFSNVEIPTFWDPTFIRQLLIGVEDSRVSIPEVT